MFLPLPLRPVAVLGGAGKTGRRVAARLAERGVPVRLASRSSPARFDWERPATWEPALRGAAAAYVAFQPDLAVPGASDTIGALAHVAAAAGVERLVLLSGRGEPEARRSEAALREAAEHGGVAWTVVRASWFAQNFGESFLAPQVLGGDLALPAGPIGEPFVDADDLADVAVAALTVDGHAGTTYEVTGPRLLTFAQVAEELSAALGWPVRYRQLTPETFVARLGEEGVPREAAELIAALFTDTLDGRNAWLGDGVQRALGRAPGDFAAYVRRAVAAGTWRRAA